MPRIGKKFLVIFFCFFNLAGISVILRGAYFQTMAKQLHYEVDVSLKLIQVSVFDKKGLPVSDLTREDFTLFIDGKKVEITEFEKHAALELKARPQEAVPASDSGASARPSRRFMLFFDFAYNSVRGIRYAQKAASQFLAEYVSPDDAVGLTSYSTTRGLRIHEFFTADHEKVKMQVDQIAISDLLGRAEDLEEAYLTALRAQEEGADPGLTPLRESGLSLKGIRASRSESAYQVLQFISVMRELVQTLRYIPGKKYVAFFSSGIPSSILYGLRDEYDSPRLESRNTLAYEDLLKEFASSNCIFFSFDGHDYGLREDSISGSYTLARMAKQSGGRYFGDITASSNLEFIQKQTQSYYVLGCPFPSARRGEYHKVRVVVGRKDVRVSAQSGFYDEKSFSDYSGFEKALQLVDLALSPNPLYQDPVRFSLRSLTAPIFKKGNLLFLAELPLAELRKQGIERVEVVDVVMDSDEHVVGLRTGTMDVGDSTQDEGVYYWALQQVPPGAYECRTIIRDLKTGRAATGKGKAYVGEAGSPGQIYAPLFFVPGNSPVFMKSSSARKDEAAEGEKTLRSLFPDEAAWRPVIDMIPDDASRLYAACPYTWEAAGQPEFGVMLSISGEGIESRDIPAVSCIQKRLGIGGILLFEVPLEPIRKGNRVVVEIKDADSGFSYSSQISVRGH
ncbi:MAG: VWA domain-containing protein [Candidatus Aminicenantes bacterium]|nr:VWA domain-containing protein [Candidatus Aminicenantes bacterium]